MSDIWYIIGVAVILIVSGIIAICRWRNLTNEERYIKVREWLLQAVMLAEKTYGSGTGRLKLSVVYNDFCKCCPWLARVIPFCVFSRYVDDALEEMKAILDNNNAIASIVESKE